MKLIGYWIDTQGDAESNYPDPADFVDTDWLKNDREKLISYLQPNQNSRGQWGYSWCRFRCGVSDEAMGSLMFTDGVWIWAEGLAHYIEHHGVFLPDEFIEHVRRNNWKVPSANSSSNRLDIDDSFWLEWSEKNKPK